MLPCSRSRNNDSHYFHAFNWSALGVHRDLRISAINGMLDSIDANKDDYLLGWDTDEFPFNVYETTMRMYEVLKAGGLISGFNFDAKNRRPSYTMEDMFRAYILGRDTFALGLIKAAKIVEDDRIDAFIADRYSSNNSDIGARIRSGETTLEELAAHAKNTGAPPLCPASADRNS